MLFMQNLIGFLEILRMFQLMFFISFLSRFVYLIMVYLLWNLGEIVKKQIFKTFEMAFSKSLKRMLGVPISTSNHAVAEIFNQLLFSHYVTMVQTRYFKRVFKSNNPLISISSFTLRNGYLFETLFRRLDGNYDVNFSRHTLDILKARIQWVQRHEPTTGQVL